MQLKTKYGIFILGSSMEFSIVTFTERLRDLMYNHFPNLYERGHNPNGSFKHGEYNEEIRDVAFKNNPTIKVDDTTLTFDIGNEYAEEHYPYYHILEDAPYIRKRNKGTKKTKGSQANVTNLGKRDYNVVRWNGKTFTQEYRRNVRGSRSRLDKVSHWVTDYKGDTIFINRESNSYLNEHYQYLERMFNDIILDALALEFNLKRVRTEKTGLEDELADYFGTTSSSILDIFQSFEED